MTKEEFTTLFDQTLNDIRTLILQSETEESLIDFKYSEEAAYSSVARVAQYLALAKSSQSLFDRIKRPVLVKDNVLPFKVVKDEESK